MNRFPIRTIRRLRSARRQKLEQLITACRLHDGDSQIPGYPFDDPDTTHYLASCGDELIGALAVCRVGDTTCEATAFVHPDYRRQGIFRRLLDAALTDCAEDDLLFVCAGALPGSMLADEFPVPAPAFAALDSLGAEPDSMELLMDCVLHETDYSIKHDIRHAELSLEVRHSGKTSMEFLLSDGKQLIGSAGLAAFRSGFCMLHNIEILPNMRRQGYGTDFLRLILAGLSSLGYDNVALQVHGDNTAAYSLYKKTGFRVSKILSYHLY